MYIIDSPDIQYWESEREDAHRWRGVIHQMRVSMHRRCDELGKDWPVEVSDELMDASNVFDVRYHYALAQLDAAHAGTSLEEILAA